MWHPSPCCTGLQGTTSVVLAQSQRCVLCCGTHCWKLSLTFRICQFTSSMWNLGEVHAVGMQKALSDAFGTSTTHLACCPCREQSGTASQSGCDSCCPAPEHTENAAHCWARLLPWGPAAWPASPSQQSQLGDGTCGHLQHLPTDMRKSPAHPWASRAGMLPQKWDWPGVLAECWALCQAQPKPGASPGAKAPRCEVGVTISWGKAQGFPHPVSGRKTRAGFAQRGLHLRLL